MLVTPEPRCSALPVRFNRPAATLTYAVSGLPTGLPCSTHPNPWPLVRFTVRLQVTPLSSVGPNTLVSRRPGRSVPAVATASTTGGRNFFTRSFRPLIVSRVLARYPGGFDRSCELTPFDSVRNAAPSVCAPVISIDWPRTSGVDAANSSPALPQAAARARVVQSRILFMELVLLCGSGSPDPSDTVEDRFWKGPRSTGFFARSRSQDGGGYDRLRPSPVLRPFTTVRFRGWGGGRPGCARVGSTEPRSRCRQPPEVTECVDSFPCSSRCSPGAPATRLPLRPIASRRSSLLRTGLRKTARSTPDGSPPRPSPSCSSRRGCGSRSSERARGTRPSCSPVPWRPTV